MTLAARDAPVAVAGAGIAGLTAALAFAAHGFPVRIHERAPHLEEIGAGLQLSPNATSILRRLGVTDALAGRHARPEAVSIRDAASLRELAAVRLGDFAEQRWGAPYLVAGRGALQSALLDRVAAEPLIALETGAEVVDLDLESEVGIDIRRGETIRRETAPLLIGADGVWSQIRAHGGPDGKSRFIGSLAWRATIAADAAPPALLPADKVTTFVAPGFHLVAYPIGGGVINLVAIAKGRPEARDWTRPGNGEALDEIVAAANPALRELVRGVAGWTVWPLHIARPDSGWTSPAGLVLIGDAAHAMAPFAAQGAAMAIEDGFVLADLVAASPGDLPAAFARYEALRRPRIRRVGQRGGLNRFAWHARGPVALARNLFLKTRSPERLAADLDWLYGWRHQEEAGSSVRHP